MASLGANGRRLTHLPEVLPGALLENGILGASTVVYEDVGQGDDALIRPDHHI